MIRFIFGEGVKTLLHCLKPFLSKVLATRKRGGGIEITSWGSSDHGHFPQMNCLRP
jgi:hypothetical protein